MFPWFDAAMAQRVDKLTRRHCEPTGNLGELRQLASIFDAAYLHDLYSVMVSGLLNNSGLGAVLQIKLAYIDKIPLAKPAGVTKKTELGDAVLFAVKETRIAGRQSPIHAVARAVLLQAKIANNNTQISRPAVPISLMNGSTEDEYNLISEFPPFDLYRTSRNKNSIADDLRLNPSGAAPPPYGWYLAAPRSDQPPSISSSTWPSWWMLGPPIRGHDCNVSFGSFLQAFLNGYNIRTANNSLDAGEFFTCLSYPPPTAGAAGWDRVCAEIINIVEDPIFKTPQSVFGANTSRVSSINEIQACFIGAISEDSYLISNIDVLHKPHPVMLWFGHHSWRSSRSGGQGKRRTPVLIIRTAVYEDG